jgi:ribosomal protein S4E
MNIKNIVLICIFHFLLINYGLEKIIAQEYRTMQEDNGSITLHIVEQYWTGWVREQPEPKIEEKTVKKGDIINLNSHYGEVIVTIKDINDSIIVVNFNSKYVVKENPNGTINLNSRNWNWTDSINYNEEYSIATQYTDAGIIWKFTFFASD